MKVEAALRFPSFILCSESNSKSALSSLSPARRLNCSTCLQVHGATLHDGRRVVMKIQYPGVARSIESDVDNLLRIISIANILPKGLYVENAAKVQPSAIPPTWTSMTDGQLVKSDCKHILLSSRDLKYQSSIALQWHLIWRKLACLIPTCLVRARQMAEHGGFQI